MTNFKIYNIKFFQEFHGYSRQETIELEHFNKQVLAKTNETNKVAFDIAKNKLFNICKNEVWAVHPLKEELVTPEIEKLLKNNDYNNDLLNDFLDNDDNYNYNKIINCYDDLYNPTIIMEHGDYSYSYDNYRVFFKIYEIKNKKNQKKVKK